MRCAIWYHLYNLKNVKNTRGRVLILVRLRASACNFTKINISPWVFFTFLKLYKWYQIVQRVTYGNSKSMIQSFKRQYNIININALVLGVH